jgi:bacterioferritin
VNGSPEIIAALNDVLTAELTTVNQYFVHAKMCDNWGYERLAHKLRDDSIEEMRDAEAVIDRILYLEGVPNMQRLSPVRVGETVPEQLSLMLDTERDAIERYNSTIPLAAGAADNGTRALLEAQLRGEEEHADWLESQLELIDQTGLGPYLAQQILE